MTGSNNIISNHHLATVDRYSHLKGIDLHDLCDATEATIKDDITSFSIGLKQASSASRQNIEDYWKGVSIMPERILFLAKLDNVISGAIQLIRPPASNHTSNFAASIENHFVAPWARGYGLAKALLQAAENEAKELELQVIKLAVRSTLSTAINLYNNFGYKCWGILDKYEKVDGRIISGHFFCKSLRSD